MVYFACLGQSKKIEVRKKKGKHLTEAVFKNIKTISIFLL